MAKLRIELPEKRVKLTAQIKERSNVVLNEYKNYLTNVHNTEISHDRILDALIENIEKDKDFKKFRTTQSKV